MTDEPRAVRRILSPLRDPLLQVDPVAVEVRRQSIVPGLLAQVALVRAEQARRRRRWGAAAAGAMVVAVLIAVLGAPRYRERAGAVSDREVDLEVISRTGAPILTEGSLPHHVLAGTRAAAGVLDSGPGGSATLRRRDGLELALTENTSLRLDGLVAQNQLTLERGRASFRVPRQAPGQPFSVVTRFGRVVVKGTRFSVDLSAGLNCVRVEEGVVEVEHGARSTTLHPHETWGCEPGVVEAKRAASQPPVMPPLRGDLHRKEPAVRGTLRDETVLLEAALAAERHGDLATARSKLEQLARRYPKSPLLPEARAALGRLQGR